MSLGLSETQSSQVLLRWSPGDTITGESFTRSTTATYITAGGVVATAAINAKRDAHLATTATGGAIVLLLEDTRTNALSRSQEFDNAAWTKGNATITANAVNGPDGTATADKLSEDASAGTAHYALRSGLTTTASTPQSVSIFAKAAERSWVRLTTSDRAGVARHSWINISSGASGTTDSGHTVRTTALTSSWYRIELVFNSGVGAGSVDWYTVLATADAIQTYNGVAGNGCYVWGGQHEQDSSFASSYIPTVAGAVTRAADYYSLPFTAPPQEISVYAKFVESGTTGVVNGRVFEIASAANADPLLTGWASSGHYSSNHEVAAVGATSTLATAPVLRDTAEVDFRLFGDGSVDTTQSINSGSSTTATQSSSLALQTAWSGPLCWLNSGGTVGGIGFTGIQSFKIVAGARSLSELRAA
jgi:hypothetical protein